MASDVPTQNSQKSNTPHYSSSTTTSYSYSYSSLLFLIGSAALAVSYLIVAFLSKGVLDSTTFAALALLTLLLLFWNLRLFEKAEPNSGARESIKLSVWLLATLLTLMFTRRLAALMPWAVATVMWTMSGTTILVGFYFILLHRDPSDARINDEEAPNCNPAK